jgi:hypothetical protein
MLASELLDRLEALSNGPRRPIAPRFVRLIEPPLRRHTLDRRHTAILPRVDGVARQATPGDTETICA